MQQENFISAVDFCTCHNIEISFIQSLHDQGLIDTEEDNEILFISKDDIIKLEKIMHLHYELNINLEGLEAIGYLLERHEKILQELSELRSRLNFYQQHLP